MATRLRLQFLGLPQVFLDEKPVVMKDRSAIALLAYLAVNDLGRPGQQYVRESLSGLFWPDTNQARAFANLRHTIWAVHQAIGENWLVADRETVQFHPHAELDLDVARFQDLLSQASQQQNVKQQIPLLVESAKVYRHHFLMGFRWKNSSGFDEWVYAEAESLRHQLAEALGLLIEGFCTLHQAESAIPHARRLSTLDPLNESAHRQLMEVYLQAGQPRAALRQYQTCEQLLRKELNLDPQPETRTLYKQILKGQARPVPVTQKIQPTPPKNNLPLQLSSFIGRQKEQGDVIRLISKHRLVTLIGSGGVGKTRLSIKMGEQVLENYIDGVWLLELASLSNPELITQTFAALFGLTAQSTIPFTDLLINFLRTKSVLLIVDNCEHLLDGCASLIETLLKSCPHLKILATSREPLGIAGEAIYFVPSLELPDFQQLIDTFRDFESIKLFEERAQLVQFDFALTLENAASVARICRCLDGIPLAIELAAAKVVILSTEQIAKQLDESFNILTGESRTALPRHQTLRASMSWSWGLLTEAEQTLMRQLSVFAGGWTLEAAEAVCGGDVFELSHSLLKKSLIVMKLEAEGETRYRFHETIRQYAHEKLAEAGDVESMRKRHRDWFLAWVETANPNDTNVAWFNLIESEHDNLRAALVWSQATHEFEIVARIAFALTEFWHIRGYIQEGRKWLESALNHRESLSKIVLAKTLFSTHGFAVRLGDYQTAEAYSKESAMLFRELGDKRNIAGALRGLGEVYMDANERERSKPFFAEAIALFQEVGDKSGIRSMLFNLGVDAITNDEYEHGMTLLNEHQSLAYELDDKVAIGLGVVYLGVAEFLQGNFDRSEKLFREGLALVRPYGNLDLCIDCLEGLAATADRRRQSVRSVLLWGAARHLYDSTGIIPGKNWVWVPRVREPTIASLRAQLGEAAFESAYAEGYAMTIDEATKYALENVEET